LRAILWRLLAAGFVVTTTAVVGVLYGVYPAVWCFVSYVVGFVAGVELHQELGV
jgi:hypothetical protein